MFLVTQSTSYCTITAINLLAGFGQICTFPDYVPHQIMFNMEKAHMILDEMIMNGHIVETNRNRVLAPVAVLERANR